MVTKPGLVEVGAAASITGPVMISDPPLPEATIDTRSPERVTDEGSSRGKTGSDEDELTGSIVTQLLTAQVSRDRTEFSCQGHFDKILSSAKLIEAVDPLAHTTGPRFLRRR